MIEAKVNIGFVQASCSDNLQDNWNKTVKGILECVEKGAQIICLQELFATPYFCNQELQSNFDLAETIPGQTTDLLRPFAIENNIVIIASLFEKRAKGIYHNTTVVVDTNGEITGKYRKMHIPDDPGYYEKYYFTPGDLGYQVVDTIYGKIGTLICWDQWFPEAARITSLMGADMIFYPTAIGWADDESTEEHQEQIAAWKTIQQSHAIANGIYVIAVNRVGKEEQQTFWGNSMVINPIGKIIKESSNDKEENIVTTIDLSDAEMYRRQWPFHRDRRIDSYKDITQRHLD